VFIFIVFILTVLATAGLIVYMMREGGDS